MNDTERLDKLIELLRAGGFDAIWHEAREGVPAHWELVDPDDIASLPDEVLLSPKGGEA